MKKIFYFIVLTSFFACQNGAIDQQGKETKLAIKSKAAIAEIPLDNIIDKKEISPYICEKGGFSILFPDSPTANQQTINAEIGQIQLHQFMYEKEETQAWLASYSDYPAQMIQLGAPKNLLKGIRNQVLSGLGASAKNEQDLKLANIHNGIAFSAHSSARKMDVLYRIYLVNNRVYQLGMFSSIGKFSAKDSSAFMGSFQLLVSKQDSTELPS